MLIDVERLPEAVDDPLGQRRSLGYLRTTFGKHRKLITAQTRQRDARAEHGFQVLGHSLEQLITDGMPKAVVDPLEVIHVDHQQRATPLVDVCRRQRLFEAVSEQQSIGQIGQRIVVSQVF